MNESKKLKGRAELDALRARAQSELDPRTGIKEVNITVHMGTCGIASGARDILAELADELEKHSAGDVSLRQSGCLGLCDQEPMLTIRDRAGGEFVYGKVDRQKVRRIVREHVLAGRPLAEYLVAGERKGRDNAQS